MKLISTITLFVILAVTARLAYLSANQWDRPVLAFWMWVFFTAFWALTIFRFFYSETPKS